MEDVNESNETSNYGWPFHSDVRLAIYEVLYGTIKKCELNKVRWKLEVPQEPRDGYLVDAEGRPQQNVDPEDWSY